MTKTIYTVVLSFISKTTKELGKYSALKSIFPKKHLRLLSILVTWSYVIDCSYRCKHILKLLSLLCRWYNNNGIPFTIKFVKDSRLLITRWICDVPLISSPEIRVKTDKSGWPSQFVFMKPEKGNLKQYREVLSLINILRPVEGIFKPEISDIIDAPSVDISHIYSIKEDIFKVLRNFRRERPKFEKWHFTTHRGPNGHGMASILMDINRTISYIDDIRVVAGDDIKNRIENFVKIIQSKVGPGIVISCRLLIGKNPIGAKLVAIPAPEGKSRIIAQIGYWLQAALIPLHKDIFDILKKIGIDLTFDQSKAPAFLKRKGDNHYHSLDLKSATDRFPIEFQKMVLSCVYDETFSKSWGNIIKQEFHTWDNQKVTYGAGQPIGAYSSWAVFSLSHHVLIRWCCLQLDIPWENNYVVLGDDVVICNDQLAERYKEEISKLGVQISMNKTHCSKHSYEIAKRWYREGEGEFTPFQFSAVLSFGPRTSQVCEYLLDYKSKGFTFLVSVPQATAIFVSAISNRLHWSHIKKSIDLAEIFWNVHTYLRGYRPGIEILRSIQRCINLPVLPSSLGTAHYINDGVANNVVVEMFTDSAEAPGAGADDVAINSMLLLTDPELTPPESLDDYISALPHLGVTGQFEEQYLAIKARAWEFDAIYSGCWDLAIRSLTVSGVTTVFSIRTSDIRQIFVSKICKKMIERIKIIASINSI